MNDDIMQMLLTRRQAEKQRRGMPEGPVSDEEFDNMNMGEDSLPDAPLASAALRKLNDSMKTEGPPMDEEIADESPESQIEAEHIKREMETPDLSISKGQQATMAKYAVMMGLFGGGPVNNSTGSGNGGV